MRAEAGLADHDDPADAAARLERALERIAGLAKPAAAVPAEPHRSTAEIAARLDALIAQVRAALGS